MVLYETGQDDALITLCGFDHHSFGLLHDLFKPFFDNYSPMIFNYGNGLITKKDSSERRGRPRSITSIMCLGLVLAWTRTRGSYMVLQLIFGLTSTRLSIWLRFGRRVLIRILKDHPLARVELPSEEELRHFVSSISDKYPSLSNVWCAMDGLKLYLERAGNETSQNNFYNGWQHDHFVNSLFVFTPDGKVRLCFLNAPGTVHDSTMAIWGQVYERLLQMFEQYGVRCVVDSAFARENSPALIKSHQSNMDGNGQIRQPSRIFRDATSVRQMAEWGMKGFKGSFPRLKDRLQYEERGERKIILFLFVLLYNFRASTVGQNQIQSTFMDPLARNCNAYLFG
jgi:hypothetical protein